MNKGEYTTVLAKGQGMVQETVTLLKTWDAGMSVVELKKLVVDQGLLGRATALRVNDIVGRVFAVRYLCDGGKPAANLKILLEEGLPPSKILQILFLYTARVNPVFHDFVTDLYWKKYAAGMQVITRRDALDFLHVAQESGRSERDWSETMMLRMARYLTGCLTDFQLAGEDRNGRRDLIPLTITPLTALYLAHEIHFAGYSDDSMADHTDWHLFGMQKQEVVQELRRLASKGHFIVQNAGDLLRISWNFKNMEDALRGIAATELQ
jgi:hypothetical protein